MTDAVDIAIVGAGAAGTMAALRAVLNNLNIALFTGDLDARRRSRAQWVSSVDNIPSVFGKNHPIAQLTPETLDHLAGIFPQNTSLQVHKTSVHRIHALPDGFDVMWQEKHRRTRTTTEGRIFASYVVLATGVMDMQPHIAGSIDAVFPFANRNQILYCITSDGHRVIGCRTAIIGSGVQAAVTAQILYERYAPPELTILTHGQPVAWTAENQNWLETHEIPVIETPIEAVVGEARGKGLEGFRVGGRIIGCDRAVVALGLLVYNEIAQQIGAELDAHGFVKTDATGQTSVPRLYAVGDLQSGRRRQIYSSWDSAVEAVEAIDRLVRIKRRSRSDASVGS